MPPGPATAYVLFAGTKYDFSCWLPMHPNKSLRVELAVLRDQARQACAQMSDTIAEWRHISAAWVNTQAITSAIREEARQVRQQARLSVERSIERRRPIPNGLPSTKAR